MNDNEQVVETQKKPKGRPRKIINLENPDNIVEEKEKKKRGRKRKEKVIEEVKQKKKRGRKAAVKFYSSSIRKNIPLTISNWNNDTCILHLDIQEETKENNSDSIYYKSYNEEVISSEIIELQSKIDELCLENEKENISDNEDVTKLYNEKLLSRILEDEKIKNIDLTLIDNKRNSEKNKKDEKEKDDEEYKTGYFLVSSNIIDDNEWCRRTDICCWWCCHQFENVPIGLPIKYIDKIDRFKVQGVFCSFACMIAYKNDYKHKYQDNYLVLYLYNKLTGISPSIIDGENDKLEIDDFNNRYLKAAPPRCALKMFGGELSIDEFRKSSERYETYDLLEYPMYISRDFIYKTDSDKTKKENAIKFNKYVQEQLIQNKSILNDEKIDQVKKRLAKVETKNNSIITIDKFLNKMN